MTYGDFDGCIFIYIYYIYIFIFILLCDIRMIDALYIRCTDARPFESVRYNPIRKLPIPEHWGFQTSFFCVSSTERRNREKNNGTQPKVQNVKSILSSN